MGVAPPPKQCLEVRRWGCSRAVRTDCPMHPPPRLGGKRLPWLAIRSVCLPHPPPLSGGRRPPSSRRYGGGAVVAYSW